MNKIYKVSGDKDIKLIYKIRNLPYVRSNSKNTKKIIFSEHLKWYENFIKKNQIYIISHFEKKVEYIRVDKNNFLSWAVRKKYWGKVNFFHLLQKLTKNKKFKAEINLKNNRSLVTCLKAGFKLKKINNKFALFTKN